MTGLIEHLEHFLGRIQGGGPAGKTPEGNVVSLAVYEPVSEGGSVHYSTIGLSKLVRFSIAEGGETSTELLMTSSRPEASSVMGSILVQVTGESLESGEPLSAGDVIGPRGRMFDGSEMEAIFVRAPEHLPEAFSPLRVGDQDIQFLWLVPITGPEAQYINEHGVGAFESIVKQQRPAFEDVHRQSVI
ncbi:suppressor of fused domain protein [Arthrobacter sp. StoSoilB5]|uniref:suppressor of fused domain protein n=1 Tax=Arthrobacter sp. StoSoilB5 TaxID=2830992 RepID=UPI001CC74F03|nr:suppressor of fused domain protein [Arthrobacter sp. StoSoilB5]